MIARRVVVRGTVQGVSYRDWTVATARDLGVRGWVRNRADGTVEAHLEGDAQAAEALVARMHDGPPAARVSAVETDTVGIEGCDGFARR